MDTFQQIDDECVAFNTPDTLSDTTSNTSTTPTQVPTQIQTIHTITPVALPDNLLQRRKMAENPMNIIVGYSTPLTGLLLGYDQDSCAANKRTVSTIKQYLENGANPNTMYHFYTEGNGKDGNDILTNKHLTYTSSLNICCSSIYSDIGIEIAELLLQHGANTDPEYSSPDTFSPLMNVLYFNHTKHAISMVELLLRHNARANMIVGGDMTVFTIIEKRQPKKNKDILHNMLLQYCKKYTSYNRPQQNINTVIKGSTLLYSTIYNIIEDTKEGDDISDSIATVKHYLDNGADPNICMMDVDKDVIAYMSPLIKCATKDIGDDGIKLIQMLLEAGASPELLAYDTTDVYENTPAILCAIRYITSARIIPIVKLLLDYGANTYTTAVNTNKDIFTFITTYQPRENATILRKMIMDARKIKIE